MRLPVVLVAVVAALVLAPAAAGSGGNSIAGAPTFPLGTPESGGGPPSQQYWRLPLVAGDGITLDLDKPQAGACIASLSLSLFEPSVSDYQIAQAQPVQTTGYTDPGKREFKWVSPFTGAGILQASGCDNGIAPFTLTNGVVHRTAVAVSAPSLARRGSIVAVRVLIQSPAGTPQGSCLIAGKPLPAITGQCMGRLRLGHRRKQTIRVEFVPDDGWQPSSGHRTIRLTR
jgi:hypothetical protein